MAEEFAYVETQHKATAYVNGIFAEFSSLQNFLVQELSVVRRKR